MKKVFILFIITLFMTVGCNTKTMNKNSYSQIEKNGLMTYTITKKPQEIIDNGEKNNSSGKYHSIRYDFGDYYIVVKYQTEKIEKNFNYVEKEVNGYKYKYCGDINSGSGLRYSAIFVYNDEYYSIEYFQFSGQENESSKEIYDNIISSIKF